MVKYTPLEIETRKIEKIVLKLKKLENKHNKDYFRRACSRYVTRTNEEIRLKYKIKDAESDLEELKKSRR